MFEWYYSFVLFYIIHIVTTLVVSNYLHRSVAHKYVIFSPNLQKFSRIWLWLIGAWEPRITTKKWAATHHKHHRLSDTEQDPHSPYNHNFLETLSILRRFDHRSPYYISNEEINKYAPDVPEHIDKLEDILISYSRWRYFFFCSVFLLLFGIGGLIFGAVGYPLIVIHLLAYNFVAHKYGYQNFVNHKSDQSKNLWGFGFIYFGEEFHNNHHNQPGNIKYSVKWYEFDPGYAIIKILQYFGLAKISDRSDQQLNE